MSNRIRTFAIASILGAASLVFVACGSDDEGPDREASTGAMKEWFVSFGKEDRGSGLRGVEIEIVNQYRTGKDIKVGIAAAGHSSGQHYGFLPRSLDNGFYAQVKSGSGEILYHVGGDSDDHPGGKEYRSELIWQSPNHNAESRINFEVVNPAYSAPKLRISNESRCFSGQVFDPGEGYSKAVDDQKYYCNIKLRVTREDDTENFKRFRIEVL